ncbi:MAG: carboxylating nicotinate-nucleotide diphosphorylase [Ahniella sp.]|nr:carboxylating nicotinate-nucleotide diphosphorylase [Ahniella sp.]
MTEAALPEADLIESDVRRALAEDIGSGDLTAQLLPADETAVARVLTREPAVLCGQAWAEACFRQLDASVDVRWLCAEGADLAANTVFLEVRGPVRALVSAERCALNFLQTLMATATVARQYAQAVAGTQTRILDTRKTLPGLRQAQKYAVRVGGASNHRVGLFDAVLIKENHIAAAGSIAAAIRRARELAGTRLVEIEVESLAELDAALAERPDRIMLDEFSREDLVEAVARTRGRVALEVSGSMTFERIADVAALGVDFISVGALTKHVRAIDLSMRLERTDRP